MMFKHFFVLISAAFFAFFAISAVTGQSGSSSREETSIEESYLQEAIELMIIRETSRSDSMDQKLIALERIGNAIERGSTNEELRTSLEYLALEGTQNRIRQGGRAMNNFPTVRRQAVKYLGTLGTPEAKNALIRVCLADNEPMVLQEAFKSLGDIGLNENNEAASAIVWVATKYNNSTAPDNLLALSALDTLEKLARKDKKIDSESVLFIAKISEGPYALPVRERARQTLVNMWQYTGQTKE